MISKATTTLNSGVASTSWEMINLHNILYYECISKQHVSPAASGINMAAFVAIQITNAYVGSVSKKLYSYIAHSSEKRGVSLMKSSSEMLQNLPYFIYTKTQICFFHFVLHNFFP